MTAAPTDPEIAAGRRAVRFLLDARAADATICPSEVARALAAAGDAPDAWRDSMPTVHAAVDAMLDAGEIRLSWKGDRLLTRAGPYRIALTATDREW